MNATFEVKQYTKKPITIEAVQYALDNAPEILAWMETNTLTQTWDNDTLAIPTLEGVMRASPGDYIIKGIRGEFYPCKPDIFRETYEETTEKSYGEVMFVVRRCAPDSWEGKQCPECAKAEKNLPYCLRLWQEAVGRGVPDI